MIVAKLLALMGLHAPHAQYDERLEKALRRVNAAERVHNRVTATAQTQALDSIDAMMVDTRLAEMRKQEHSLRALTSAVLERTR